MNPRIFEITLSGFSFPDSEDLKDNQANFRFLVDLRFVDANGEPRVVHTIMPSAANFWECDTDEKDKPNFVRKQDGQDANGNPKFLPKFDMDKIEDWDKGKRQGRWVQRLADGGVQEGPFVEGKRQGQWVERWADGRVREGPFVEGFRHGRWVLRHADGSTEVTIYKRGMRVDN